MARQPTRVRNRKDLDTTRSFSEEKNVGESATDSTPQLEIDTRQGHTRKSAWPIADRGDLPTEFSNKLASQIASLGRIPPSGRLDIAFRFGREDDPAQSRPRLSSTSRKATSTSTPRTGSASIARARRLISWVQKPPSSSAWRGGPKLINSPLATSDRSSSERSSAAVKIASASLVMISSLSHPPDRDARTQPFVRTSPPDTATGATA